MHIALVKRKCSLQVGGSERYCVLLARGLLQAGHSVTVIGESIDDDLKSEIDFQAVPILKLTSSTKNRSFAVNAGRAIQKANYDVTYGLGRSLGVDAVRVTERIQSHWLEVNYQKTAWIQKWNPRHRTLIDLERKIYTSGSTKAIITQSNLDRELLIRNYGIANDRIHVIPNGVDKSKFSHAKKDEIRGRFSIPENCPVILFVGNDFYGKGLETVIKSLSKCDNRLAHLIVVGSGPEKVFKRIANGCGLNKRIHFAGRQSNMPSFYSASDVSILPTKYEPFPNVVLESLSCGTPVITTPHSGAAELIQERKNGYLIKETAAIEELTKKLALFFQQPEFKKSEMRKYAERSIEEYSLEKNIRTTESLLRKAFEMKMQSVKEAA